MQLCCYCCYICTQIFVLPVFICFFSRITSTHLYIQLHVYPANSFNMHSLSDVKGVVFIYRCEFLEKPQSKVQNDQTNPELLSTFKFATLSGYSLLASTSLGKGVISLMAGIEITLIYLTIRTQPSLSTQSDYKDKPHRTTFNGRQLKSHHLNYIFNISKLHLTE